MSRHTVTTCAAIRQLLIADIERCQERQLARLKAWAASDEPGKRDAPRKRQRVSDDDHHGQWFVQSRTAQGVTTTESSNPMPYRSSLQRDVTD